MSLLVSFTWQDNCAWTLSHLLQLDQTVGDGTRPSMAGDSEDRDLGDIIWKYCCEVVWCPCNIREIINTRRTQLSKIHLQLFVGHLCKSYQYEKKTIYKNTNEAPGCD